MTLFSRDPPQTIAQGAIRSVDLPPARHHESVPRVAFTEEIWCSGQSGNGDPAAGDGAFLAELMWRPAHLERGGGGADARDDSGADKRYLSKMATICGGHQVDEAALAARAAARAA